jgi:hypothetical protein
VSSVFKILGTLGFLNPTLYNIGAGSSYNNDFHDTTSGSNGKCKAVTGFDLVTGWGSPNDPNLLNTLVGSGEGSVEGVSAAIYLLHRVTN